MIIDSKRGWIMLIGNVIIPLCAGALLYYYFCPDVLFVKWADRNVLRGEGIHASQNWRNLFLRYYLFDLLWAYALTNSLFLALRRSLSATVILVMSIMTEVTMESLQLVTGIPGTFDVADIAVEALSSLVVFIFFYKKEWKHEKK